MEYFKKMSDKLKPAVVEKIALASTVFFVSASILFGYSAISNILMGNFQLAFPLFLVAVIFLAAALGSYLTYLSTNQKQVPEEKVRQIVPVMIILLLIFFIGFISLFMAEWL